MFMRGVRDGKNVSEFDESSREADTPRELRRKDLVYSLSSEKALLSSSAITNC